MSRHASHAIAVIVVGLLLTAASAGPAAATPPGINGRLTFMRFDDDGRFQIWVANPDMSRQVQLTHGPAEDGWFPTWSPDGTRIAFSSSRSDPDPNDGIEIHDVYTMRPDGGDVRKITDSAGYNGKPSWSPDGQWLVFDADRGDYPRSQGLYLIRSDGSGQLRRLTTLPEGSTWQELGRFSPDGTRIAFDEGRGGNVLRNHREGTLVGEQAALFTVRLDGTDRRQLTPWGAHCGDPDWSPNGARLVFACQPVHAGNIGDVNMVDADGKHLVDVTHDHGLSGFGNVTAIRYAESFNATWSPDGTKIIFVHASFTAEDGFRMGLQTMNPDGSGRVWISSGEEHQPEWGTAPVLT